MALQAAYKQFLAAPNSSALAADASLHYITSTTTFSGATEIIKHLATLRNQVKKKKEDALNVVEGANSIAVEIEASFEFLTGGGPYLPGLDDNFLTDRTVSLAIIHLVTFDTEGKIAQIRQSWDQGSLLKQLEVIGRTGRNWPIRDSRDQIALLYKSIKSHDGASVGAAQELPVRSRGNSTNILRDPHASLSLFAPREEKDNLPNAVVSPYAGNRPRQRSFTEILGDEGPEDEEGDSPSRGRSRSPSKSVAPKAGASKNFQPIRLFEKDENAAVDQDTPEKNQSPDRFYRPHPKKYEHFDFVDGSNPEDAPARGVDFDKKPKTKHDSTWSFDDFETPQKPTVSRGLHRARDVRHWGNTEEESYETPAAKPPQQVKARRDAEAHFELQDDGFPSDEPRVVRPRGATHNTNLGLYKNNLYNEDGTAPTPGPRALDTITNLKDRHKDFNPHFEMTDDVPQEGEEEPAAKVGENRQKAVRMMESNWTAYDESPAAQKENSNPTKKGDDRGISTTGDGMGGKKGSGRGWAIGDDSEEELAPRPAPKKQHAQAAKSSFWDF
ncbi:hypothetical protein GQ53DRAFT_219076 [Thozetella sp. PMI_491]|nr:hypothetical protein GQ53DRAFT_219076 [Thozetella sp. PMI_491]